MIDSQLPSPLHPLILADLCVNSCASRSGTYGKRSRVHVRAKLSTGRGECRRTKYGYHRCDARISYGRRAARRPSTFVGGPLALLVRRFLHLGGLSGELNVGNWESII